MSLARDIADLASVTTRLDTVGGSSGALSNRNLIINGAMQVAQRGTSFTGSGEYTLDRFYQQESGGTATTTQETFALGSELEGFTKYLKMVVSTGNDYCGILHKVEDVKSLPQGKATFSFYAKGTNPSTGSLEVKIIRMHDGSTVHDTILNTTATLTSSWQRFTNTFDVGSLSGMSTPNANSLLYIAIRQSGSDTGTAAWELNLTGVQLEVGDTATDFEHRRYDDELLSCKRYFESKTFNTFIGVGYANIATSAHVVFPYLEKRAAPTVTLPTAGQGTNEISFLQSNGSYPSTTGSNSVFNATKNQARIQGGSYSGLTAAGVSALFINGEASVTIDAEL